MKELLGSEPMKGEIAIVLKSTGFQTLEEMMRSVTPLMICANVMFYNLILSFVLSIPTAWLSKSNK